MSFSDIDPDRLPIIGENLMEEFDIGSIVRWVHDLRHEKIGIILEIYTQRMANRLFPHAKVYVMGEDRHEEVLLAILTIISNK
jgi:hypothetical protein